MADGNTPIEKGEPNHPVLRREQTLAIVLGASEWPSYPDFHASPSFRRSAEDIVAYLRGRDGLNIPPRNLKVLIDPFDDAPEVLRQVRDFIRRRRDDLTLRGTPATDLLLYYVGHGGFGDGDAFFLSIRSTEEEDPSGTSITAESLGRLIRERAAGLRTYLVLDCCFAASVSKVFMSPGPVGVAGVQLQDLLPPQGDADARRAGALPTYGTALLCASGPKEPAKAPPGLPHTMFTGGLLDVLRNGDPSAPAWLSLDDMQRLVRARLEAQFTDKAVLPQVHAPQQRMGRVDLVPLFGNPAHSGLKLSQPQAREIERLGDAPETVAIKIDGGVRGTGSVSDPPLRPPPVDSAASGSTSPPSATNGEEDKRRQREQRWKKEREKKLEEELVARLKSAASLMGGLEREAPPGFGISEAPDLAEEARARRILGCFMKTAPFTDALQWLFEAYKTVPEKDRGAGSALAEITSLLATLRAVREEILVIADAMAADRTAFWASGIPPVWAHDWDTDEHGPWVTFRVPAANGSWVEQRLRWIPPGRFWMGSLDEEDARFSDEGPRHEVTLTEGFWLFDTACTEALWEAVTGKPPEPRRGAAFPVTNVSWDDAQAFIRQINAANPGLDLALPSELWWEYACRAGTETPYYFGTEITRDLACYEADAPVPVGSLPPNRWGLREMHGNVLEWCSDTWHGDYRNAPTDGSAWIDAGGAANRVMRGGSWANEARGVRSAYRDRSAPSYRFDGIGFRCARVQG